MLFSFFYALIGTLPRSIHAVMLHEGSLILGVILSTNWSAEFMVMMRSCSCSPRNSQAPAIDLCKVAAKNKNSARALMPFVVRVGSCSRKWTKEKVAAQCGKAAASSCYICDEPHVAKCYNNPSQDIFAHKRAPPGYEPS